MEAGAPRPWLCHTFSSKAMGYLAAQLQSGAIPDNENVVFWCTKTLVQPASSRDVFAEKSSSPQVVQFINDSSLHARSDFFAQKYTKEF